jgi:hypothetical protein
MSDAGVTLKDGQSHAIAEGREGFEGKKWAKTPIFQNNAFLINENCQVNPLPLFYLVSGL